METWSDSSQDLSLPGFDLIHRNSRKRDKKQGVIPVESLSTLNMGIAKGVKPLKNKQTDIAWTKLDHSHLS